MSPFQFPTLSHDLSAIVAGSRQSSLSRYLRHRRRILPIGALSFSSPDSPSLSVIVAELATFGETKN
ncbi:unnamed protein product [Linum trigynum]|uniref:Uncharacterized protein n=1 Tax=Linum trigynum TaxID=586398 RepID=A0AAV2D8V4_9ROSI